MALREFSDGMGRRWRAWDIVPEELHPVTRLEDYLQGFLDGWLVFEAMDGAEKRRLCPIPGDWDGLSDAELEGLRLAAAPVRPEPAPAVADDQPECQVEAPSDELRTFAYPGGRVWSVAEVPVQYRDREGHPLGEARTVLRFTSGARELDLLAWPRNWARRTDEELAELLYCAFPRGAQAGGATSHRRRRGDERAARA